MIGYDQDSGGPKDSEIAPNSFLTKNNRKGFWQFVPVKCKAFRNLCKPKFFDFFQEFDFSWKFSFENSGNFKRFWKCWAKYIKDQCSKVSPNQKK